MKKMIIVCILYLLISIVVTGQDAITNSVVVLVNSTRNQAGIAGLIVSPELTVAAQRHSNDMATAGILDHVGTDGSQFWQRMSDAGYTLITGAENILLRSDTNAQAVYNQWYNSPPHQANMMNPEYIEVGVAYAQSADGTVYFTMVLGARDGMSAPPLPPPPTTPPTFTPTIPTSTPIPPTATIPPPPTATFTATPLVQPTRTLSPLITPQIFPTSSVQITPFVPTFTPSPEPLPDIRLIYDDQSLSLLNVSGINLDVSGIGFESDQGDMLIEVWDTEFLTEPLNNFSPDDCLQVWELEVDGLLDKVEDCDIRHGWVAVNDAQIFWKDVTTFWVANEDELIGQCMVADGLCDLRLDGELEQEDVDAPLATPTSRELRLIFNQDSFTIVNSSSNPINLRGLVFQSSGGTLLVEDWETEFLTASLGGFPADDCLMVWTFGTDELPSPQDCETRHGWIMVGEDADFWRDATRFDVIRNNRVLAGCVIANGFCDVSLAGNLGANSPTVAPVNPPSITATPISDTNTSPPIATTNNDLTLVYSVDSFTVINTSGRSLNLSGLVFESDNGVFAATRWNTEFLTRSLGDFPSGDCLQVWGVGEELQAKPSGCGTRHSWVAVAVDAQFWRNASQVRVRDGVTVIGSCDLRVNQCALNFP